jgi:catalase-peroxidase
VLGANHGDTALGVFTRTPGSLTNDFFVNLLDTDIEWAPRAATDAPPWIYEGRNRHTSEVAWVATRVDFIFRAHSQLRALSEDYASQGAEENFVRDFVSAWDKVMRLDFFDPTT